MSGAGVVYRARAYDTPDDPFTTSGPAFRYDDDLGLAVSDDGVITARGPFASVAAAHPDAPVIDLRGPASCCPGWSTPTSTSPRCG